MTDLLIRNLDADVKALIKKRARKHGRSMSEEAKLLLRRTLIPTEDKAGLGSQVSALFASLGGVDLDLPPDEFPEENRLFR